MSKPEWIIAPEDATHWAPETDFYHASWYKFKDGSWFCVNVDSYQTFRSPWYGLGHQMRRDDLEPRP